nr:hypothetical protein [Xanthobacter autotrophicus]
MGAHDGGIEHLDQMRRAADARVSKNSSNTPAWRSRQNLFQTLFHAPNSAGSARQEMLCTVK